MSSFRHIRNIIHYYQSDTPSTSGENGRLWYHIDERLYILENNVWNLLGIFNQGQSNPADIGIIAGGRNIGSAENSIDYVQISNSSNSAEFGELDGIAGEMSGTSNSSGDIGLFIGGAGYIEWITISTPSNSDEFGNLTVDPREYGTATSNGYSDTGIFAGGKLFSSYNTIEKVTISSSSNASNHGDLYEARYDLASCSNDIDDTGVFIGGQISSFTNIIDYITISTGGTASLFGRCDSNQPTSAVGATSNGTNDHAVYAGGAEVSRTAGITDDICEFIITSIGNANWTGNLTTSKDYMAGTSNGINDRAIWPCGELNTSAELNNIDKSTISTGSSASDFGDLTSGNRRYVGACSNS